MQKQKNENKILETTSGICFSNSILNSELRDFLAVPRKIPRPLREEIAELLSYEIFSGKNYEIKDENLFIEKFGVFYPLFLEIRNFEIWEDIKVLAGTNRMAGVFVLKNLLEEVFTFIGEYEKIEPDLEKKLQINLKKTLQNLKMLIEETLFSWENVSLKKQATSKIQESFEIQKVSESQKASKIQKYPEIQEYQDSGFQSSEKLVSMTLEFMADENALQAFDSIIGERIAAKLEAFISALESHLDLLEILSLLFPGRNWDYSLEALHREYFGNLEKYAGLLRKNSEFRKILEQVGRIELESGSKKLTLSPYSKNEVHEVTFSGDIQAMLPAEVVKLKSPLLKQKFYADLLEGKLLSYQLRGRNWNSNKSGNKRRGPVIALVDTSASMRGRPETLAKAVVLAAARKMISEGRDVKVILFSSKWQTLEIDLTDKKRMGMEFLDFLRYSFGGGTDFNTALRAGLKALKEDRDFQGADLLFITDGFSEISEKPLLREWNTIKVERKARIFSLILGNCNAGGLGEVSDYTYLIRDAGNWGIEESPAGLIKAIGRPMYR